MMMVITLEVHLKNPVLSRVLSRIREIFVWTLIGNLVNFWTWENFVNFYIMPFVDQLKCTLVKTWPLNFKSAMPKSTHYTYLHNIDTKIANRDFCKYRIDIVSKFKKWYRISTIHICLKNI